MLHTQLKILYWLADVVTKCYQVPTIRQPNEGVFFHLEDAPLQRALESVATLIDFEFELCDHTHYYPDLTIICSAK